MEIKTCEKCNRLFYYVTGECLCQPCKEYLEKIFQEVSKYIAGHTGASMAQVSKNCNVPLSQIKRWIKEERLHTVDELEVYSVCDGCGSQIPSGNFCSSCKARFVKEIKYTLDQNKKENVEPKRVYSKMRFAGRRKGRREC